MEYKHNDLVFDLMSLFSFVIGLENLGKNEEQIKALEEHLAKQDKQYERIIELLENHKEVLYGRTRKEKNDS